MRETRKKNLTNYVLPISWFICWTSSLLVRLQDFCLCWPNGTKISTLVINTLILDYLNYFFKLKELGTRSKQCPSHIQLLISEFFSSDSKALDSIFKFFFLNYADNKSRSWFQSIANMKCMIIFKLLTALLTYSISLKHSYINVFEQDIHCSQLSKKIAVKQWFVMPLEKPPVYFNGH